MLRITNNRKKAKMSMDVHISHDELDAVLSGSLRNIRLGKMLASWTYQIKDLMLELADTKETDKDVKEIRTILQERLLGVTLTQKPVLRRKTYKESVRSDKEIRSILSRFGLGKPKKKPLTPAELQEEVMAEEKKKRVLK